MRRGWLVSIFWAVVFTGLGVTLSAIINPLLGRVVHWGWMAGIASVAFGLLTLALRRRWV